MGESGIKDFAKCLSVMQEMRIHLLKGDNQNIRLGQMLEEAKDLVKDEFLEITLGKYEEKP